MKPNLPATVAFVGMGALSVSQVSKELAPETLGRFTPLHWGCALASAFLFSVGFFLSLYGLFTQQKGRSGYLLSGFCSLLFLVGLPSFYFFIYVISTKIYHLDELPSMLPKMVEYAQSAHTEQQREESAQGAYEFYGVKIAYRRENGDLARYEPSGEAVAYFVKQKQIELETQSNKERLKGAMNQWPYLFGFYMGAFFLTFLFGSLWALFKKPSAGINLQS